MRDTRIPRVTGQAGLRAASLMRAFHGAGRAKPQYPYGPPMVRKSLSPLHFLNRELGVLEFNRRVLAQAADDSVPLIERLRFLTIVSSNLDEFFEIRVAGLKEQVKAGIKESGP